MRSLFLFLWLVASTLEATSSPIIYLTWQQDPTTTMTVNWITLKTCCGEELFFKQSNEESYLQKKSAHAPLPENAPYCLHSIELTNLDANNSYDCIIDDTPFHFRTLPKNLENPLSFIVGGDTNQSKESYFIDTCKKAAEEKPSFVLFGGDLAYAAPCFSFFSDDCERWVHWLSNYATYMRDENDFLIPLLVTIGNHDVKGHYSKTPEKAPFYYHLFPFPGRPGYNRLHIGSFLSIYFLDTNHTNPIEGKQTEWLEKALQEEQERPHRFALYHVPAYPTVHSFFTRESKKIREHWVPLFEKYGLDVALENHEHLYSRSCLLKEGEENPEGILYMGVGSWGVRPRVPRRNIPYIAKSSSSRQCTKITLSKEGREFHTFAPDGTLLDHFEQLGLTKE